MEQLVKEQRNADVLSRPYLTEAEERAWQNSPQQVEKREQERVKVLFEKMDKSWIKPRRLQILGPNHQRT